MRVFVLIVSTLGLVACGNDPSSECEAEKNQCDGVDALKACVGGVWQAPQACSAICQAKGLLSGGCSLDATGKADCLCSPVCTLGETKCEGLNLRTCTGTQWETAACDGVCKSGGYTKATGCALDSTKKADACTCESPAGWGESCSAAKVCPNGFVCVAYGGKSFCTQACPTVGAKCGGTPTGTYGGCLIKMSDGTYTCAFLCKNKTGSYTCPGTMTCASTENPAGSGQFTCLP